MFQNYEESKNKNNSVSLIIGMHKNIVESEN